MRSLIYLVGRNLFGREVLPRNRDDCLDFSKIYSVSSIQIRLTREFQSGDIQFLEILDGIFVWTFEHVEVSYRETLGIVGGLNSEKDRVHVLGRVHQTIEKYVTDFGATFGYNKVGALKG